MKMALVVALNYPNLIRSTVNYVSKQAKASPAYIVLNQKVTNTHTLSQQELMQSTKRLFVVYICAHFENLMGNRLAYH